MKKVVLNKLYESSTPPADTSVLWVERDSDGEIKVIHRYRRGEWQPYLVSVDFLKPIDVKPTKQEEDGKSKT